MSWARTIAIILVVFLLGLLVWWSGPGAPKRPGSSGDGTRIVSLAPSLSEILFAINRDDLLVGATQFCKVPDEIPHVGGLKIDVEQVLALEPNLVLAIATTSQEPSLDAIRAAGIDVEVLKAETIGDVEQCVRRLGELLDAQLVSKVVANKIKPLVNVAPPGSDAPTVLFVVDREPLYVAGGGSFVTAMLHAAGARNLFEDRAESYLAVTIEDIFDRNPDLVVDASFPDPDAAADTRAEYWRRFEKLPAVQGGKVHPFPQVTPGIQVTTWTEQLRALVRP